MFCQNCGTNNENGAKYCASCGTEIVDNQPTAQPVSFGSITKRAGQIPIKETLQKAVHGLKAMPKRMKVLCFGGTALIVAIAVFFIIGSALTSPKNIVKGFFEARTDGDWEKVYGYLPYEDSEFINAKSFAKLMKDQIPMDVLNYEIMEPSENEDDSASRDWIKTYAVEYLVQGETRTRTEPFTLTRQKDKKYLFFAHYTITLENFWTVSDFTITVPKDSVVYLNDTEVTQKETEDSDSLSARPSDASAPETETFLIPELFISEYELTVEHPDYGAYTEKVYIGEDSSAYTVAKEMFISNEPSVNTENMEEQEAVPVQTPPTAPTSTPIPTPTPTPENDAKPDDILNGDFSYFAGTYTISYGNSITINNDGTFLWGDDLHVIGEVAKFDDDDTYYVASADNYDFGFRIIPIGVDTEEEFEVATDTSIVRLYANNDMPMSPDDFYYKVSDDGSALRSAPNTQTNSSLELSDLVFQGKERYYTREELIGKSADDLSILRNGMFALSGKQFVRNMEVKAFFEGCSWYMPDTSDDAVIRPRFNDFQRQNLDLIGAVESQLGYTG